LGFIWTGTHKVKPEQRKTESHCDYRGGLKKKPAGRQKKVGRGRVKCSKCEGSGAKGTKRLERNVLRENA